VDALHLLKIWLYAPGICKMSKTNMLIRNELHEDIIKKAIHKKRAQL
jgi:hypothetical protein